MQNELTQPKVEEQGRRLYRAIWRWHFYAGVFCIPFVIWLSITGSIYLFRPQIERWLDRPYDHLHIDGNRTTPERIARAAVAAVPHSSLHYYELPPGPDAAARVVVGVGTEEFRVYVHPVTDKALYIINEDHRPMTLLAHLHGQLLAGRWGSYLIELAASWAIVLLLTGLYLWWPRQTEKLGGVLWVRFGKAGRIFWRDLHAVSGVWISAFALFLILTGLPWANGWGTYFKRIRQMTGTAAAHQDWTTGRASELAARAAMNSNSLNAVANMPDMPSMEHADHVERMMRHPASEEYSAFDRLVPLAASLGLAAPIKIMPAAKPGGLWTIKSDSQNRTLRDVVQADPQTGAVVGRQNFDQTMLLDRVVNIGIATHEGQLFGLFNQFLGLLTTLGLITLCVSAVAMWWRRRRAGMLGAPLPLERPRWSFAVFAAVFALALYLPELGVSLILVLLTEKFILSRIPATQRWLGLAPA
ncbi:MAG TPA: PepSY domain-containing protein [Bryobacteraceae bacterium]|nr:PepSY domain-containing protein [Bryobacteraceae bacterium]